MIYLFYGSDVERVRTKAFEWVAAARKKQPEVSYVRLSREEISPEALLEVASAGSLFVKRLLVLIDDPFGKTEEGTETPLEEYIDQLAASDNAIIILAPKLLASRAKKIGAKAEKVYQFDAKEKAETRGFNIGLVNALAAKSRARLWLEIIRALRAGDAPEMVHGLLHWKARQMNSRELSLALILLLQDSRRKGLDLSVSLEKFALSL